MSSSRYLSVLVLASCGRFEFASVDRDANAGGDASNGDANGDAAQRANVVFVTAPVSAAFAAGKDPMDAGAAICSMEADAAGLPGTFVAWISTTTKPAHEQLVGSRGWVRPDGAPFADDVTGLTSGAVFSPISLDARGQSIGARQTWTGTSESGTTGAFGTCADWTDATGSTSGTTGLTDSATFSQTNSAQCNLSAGLFCFEIGHDVAVVPPVLPRDRIAFLSEPIANGSGLAGFDATCAANAIDAGLPGTYLAAVATSATTISSRFAVDSRAWTTVDGAVIAPTGGALFDGSARLAFIHQRADGTRVGANTAFGIYTWSGATDASSVAARNCNDWTDPSGTIAADSGAPAVLSGFSLWYWGSSSCNSPLPVVCLQE